MKAKVISTGEIIDVKSLYPTVYSRFDCNGQTIEMYDKAELEFISNHNKPKMVSLDKVCEFLKNLIDNNIIEQLRKEFE
jgi:hypothetical protein